MSGPDRALRAATGALFSRYETILDELRDDPLDSDPRLSIENLTWMCREGRSSIDDLPIDKLSRWLGFIQGCLAMRGIIDVDEERDVSRPLFHAAYARSGSVPTVRERR